MRLLDRYEEIVGHQEVERLRRLAERLAGKRIVHVNSTRSGGGVAEILGWMVPLLEELGINARWEVIAGPPDFYRVTKAFHNGLQGLPVSLRKSDFDLALRGQSGKCPAAEPGGGHRFRARSATDLSSALYAAGPGGPLDLALPHRRFASESRDLEISGDGDLPLRCGGLLDARLRAAAGVPDVPDPAFDRPAVGQELRHSRGGAAGDAFAAGHRPGTAAVGAGLAVRSLQGSAGRYRGVSLAATLLPGNAVGVGRRTGRRRPGRGRGSPRGPRSGG